MNAWCFWYFVLVFVCDFMPYLLPLAQGCICRGGRGGSAPLVKMPTPPAARAKMAWGVDYNPPANPSPFTMYHFAYGDDPT